MVGFHSLYDRCGKDCFDSHDHRPLVVYFPVIGGDPVVEGYSTIDAHLCSLVGYHLEGNDRYDHLALTYRREFVGQGFSAPCGENSNCVMSLQDVLDKLLLCW